MGNLSNSGPQIIISLMVMSFLIILVYRILVKGYSLKNALNILYNENDHLVNVLEKTRDSQFDLEKEEEEEEKVKKSYKMVHILSKEVYVYSGNSEWENKFNPKITINEGDFDYKNINNFIFVSNDGKILIPNGICSYLFKYFNFKKSNNYPINWMVGEVLRDFEVELKIQKIRKNKPTNLWIWLHPNIPNSKGMNKAGVNIEYIKKVAYNS